LERSRYAVPHSEAERSCGPLQSGGLAEDDPVIEDAWIGAGSQDPNQAEGDDGGREYYPENRDLHERFPFSRPAAPWGAVAFERRRQQIVRKQTKSEVYYITSNPAFNNDHRARDALHLREAT
jgi:hypothetical protein